MLFLWVIVHQHTSAQKLNLCVTPHRPLSSAVPAAAAYQDPTYTQPAKKQKKAATPITAPATAPRPSRPAPSTKSRAAARSAPTTPAAGVRDIGYHLNCMKQQERALHTVQSSR